MSVQLSPQGCFCSGWVCEGPGMLSLSPQEGPIDSAVPDHPQHPQLCTRRAFVGTSCRSQPPRTTQSHLESPRVTRANWGLPESPLVTRASRGQVVWFAGKGPRGFYLRFCPSLQSAVHCEQ